MDERLRFVAQLLCEAISEVCSAFGISRKDRLQDHRAL